MKSEKVSPRKKLKAVSTAANLSRVQKTRASPPGGEACNSGNRSVALSPEERRLAIESAAYSRAERRGYSGGSPEHDWLEAETEIDLMSKADSQSPS